MSENKTKESTQTKAVEVEVDLTLIDLDPTNRRDYTQEDVDERADQMKSQGQLQAIELRPRGERYLCTFGHVRVLSARQLKWKTIRAVVLDVDDLEAKKRQIMENNARTGVSPYNEYLQLMDLVQLGIPRQAGKLAAASGMKVGTVKNRLELGELPESVGRRVDRNGFSQAHARFLAPLGSHEAILNALIARMVDGKADIAKLEDFARDVVSFLLAEKLALTPITSWFDYSPLKLDDVRALVEAHKPVKLKTPTHAYVLVLDVAAFKEAAKKRGEEVAAEREAARKAERDPTVPGRGETAAQKKKRLAEEAARLEEQKRREALRAKADKMMGQGLAAAVAKLDAAAASWLAVWMNLGLASEEEAAIHFLASVLGVTPGKAHKLMTTEYEDMWEEGVVVVPKLWAAASEAQRRSIVLGLAVFSDMARDTGDALLHDLTGLDEQGWRSEAEHPKRRKDEAAEAPNAEGSQPPVEAVEPEPVGEPVAEPTESTPVSEQASEAPES